MPVGLVRNVLVLGAVGLDSPPLVFALAMLAGVLAQALGRHVLVPGIVILIGVGVLLGPDVADIIRPAALGAGLNTIVGFAVAVILFEGGMRLDIGRLRREGKVIRRLVGVGTVLTTLGGTLACRFIMGWPWRTSFLFGTLVIVTGPTVIAPLVRRIHLAPSLATILEAEGVFIDVVGATVAVVALEVVLRSPTDPLGAAVLGIVERIGVGVAIGLAGGLVLGGLLRVPRLVPRGTENILALAAAVTVYQTSHTLVPESGIPAAVVAGLVVGNLRIQRISQLVEFKSQLTVLLIGTLFVLLAADVRLEDVARLGWRGPLVVAVLALVVRPVIVAISAAHTQLRWREQLLVAWIGPRGIVAASVASLFAVQLNEQGIAGGNELRALVFEVIALTVVVEGLTAGPLASLVGLRRPSNIGYLFLGANPLAIHLARRIADSGQAVELIDTNPDDCRAAEEAGLKVIYGNGLDPRTLARGRADTRAHAVAVTPNESVNLLFARRLLDDFDIRHAVAAVHAKSTGVGRMAAEIGARVLFARGEDLGAWLSRWRRRHVTLVRRRWHPAPGITGETSLATLPVGSVMPLVVERGGSVFLVDDATHLRPGDIVELAVATDVAGGAPVLVDPPWAEVAHSGQVQAST